MIWNRERECLSQGEKQKLQDETLKQPVKRVYNRVPFYKNRMEQEGIKVKDIKGIKDIFLLPFTTKDDLRENYPFGMFAVPMDRVVEVHTSSGTTGKPVIGRYTSGI